MTTMKKARHKEYSKQPTLRVGGVSTDAKFDHSYILLVEWLLVIFFTIILVLIAAILELTQNSQI
jgi:hypothetical protein